MRHEVERVGVGRLLAGPPDGELQSRGDRREIERGPEAGPVVGAQWRRVAECQAAAVAVQRRDRVQLPGEFDRGGGARGARERGGVEDRVAVRRDGTGTYQVGIVEEEPAAHVESVDGAVGAVTDRQQGGEREVSRRRPGQRDGQRAEMSGSSVAPSSVVSRMSPVLAWAMLKSGPLAPAVRVRPPFSRQA